jgi:hypothetical protein
MPGSSGAGGTGGGFGGAFSSQGSTPMGGGDSPIPFLTPTIKSLDHRSIMINNNQANNLFREDENQPKAIRNNLNSDMRNNNNNSNNNIGGAVTSSGFSDDVFESTFATFRPAVDEPLSASIPSTRNVQVGDKPVTIYKIRTTAQSGKVYEVERRYSDFQELNLRVEHLGDANMPKVPPKIISPFSSQTKEEFINTRREQLESYIQALIVEANVSFTCCCGYCWLSYFFVL